MRKNRPFTGLRIGKSKSYEDEFNLAKESLIKSNKVVVENNAIIRSQVQTIAELKAIICKHEKTIKNQQEVIERGKNLNIR